MSVEASGTAIVRHADTNVEYEIHPDELDWQVLAVDERQMGPEIGHNAEVAHPELGQLSWWLWEYPIGAENDQEVDVGRHTLVKNFAIRLAHEPDDREEERQARIDRMVEWFHSNFEDPANRTPYESAEGGYIYIWGGPYDALDQIASEFPNEDQDLIEAAVEEVQSDGIFEWSPVEAPGDYDDEPLIEEGHDQEPPISDFEEPIEPEELGLSEILSAIPEATNVAFRPNANDRIEFAGWEPGRQVDIELREAIRSTTALVVKELDGTNAHKELFEAVKLYESAIGTDPTSISQIYAHGVVLENILSSTNSQIALGDLPPLKGHIGAQVDSLLELHGALVMSTAAGANLVEASRRFSEKPDEANALGSALKDVASAVREAKDLFGPEARAMAATAEETAAAAPRPARSNQIANWIVGGLLAATGSALLAAGKYGLMTIIGDGLAATPIGVEAMHGVTLLGANAWNFLVANIEALKVYAGMAGQDAVWLRNLAAWIESRRK